MKVEDGAQRAQLPALLSLLRELDALPEDLPDGLKCSMKKPVRNTRGESLSGGERRRTEIARALATEPQFILLDEPFAGIDPKAVDEIQSVILYLRSRGIGILVTDHNVRETLGVTDRAYIMAEGKIFRSGAPRDLTEDAEVRRLYLGDKFRM